MRILIFQLVRNSCVSQQTYYLALSLLISGVLVVGRNSRCETRANKQKVRSAWYLFLFGKNKRHTSVFWVFECCYGGEPKYVEQFAHAKPKRRFKFYCIYRFVSLLFTANRSENTSVRKRGGTTTNPIQNQIISSHCGKYNSILL